MFERNGVCGIISCFIAGIVGVSCYLANRLSLDNELIKQLTNGGDDFVVGFSMV